MTDPAIRPASAADWPQVHAFFSRTVADGETYAYPEELSSDQARALWFGQEHVVVLEEGDRILGSAIFGPNRPGRGDHVGTASFMVDEAARGSGVGRRLGEYVVARLGELGYRGIQFNAVVETNEAAVRLWQDLGFEIVGTVPGAFRSRTHGFVGLHVMYRDL